MSFCRITRDVRFGPLVQVVVLPSFFTVKLLFCPFVIDPAFHGKML